MSNKKEVYPCGGDIFIRPDMPVTFWRCVWGGFLWLTYGTGCVLTGYYISCGFSLPTRAETAPQAYYLSEAHYVYKKRPLPVPEEEGEETVFEERVDEAPATPEAPEINADLRARVKQAMADIDRQ